MTMNKSVSVAAFLVGLAAVVWVGSGYVGLSPLALGMTVLIALVYMVGVMELVRFDRATTALSRALGAIPAQLSHPGEWLSGLPPTLQNTVRLRIEGERVGLPGPVLTPYLVGLLVLLGAAYQNYKRMKQGYNRSDFHFAGFHFLAEKFRRTSYHQTADKHCNDYKCIVVHPSYTYTAKPGVNLHIQHLHHSGQRHSRIMHTIHRTIRGYSSYNTP